jgi:arylsulfatase A-like enzyme
MKLRSLVMRVIAAALFAVCAVVPAAARATDARPNFLFIITDDQRYDAMSVVQEELGDRGRFPWFKTPNMDRLAREGARFRNAFVVNALCSPSRANFLTGRYNHHNGVINNHTPLSAEHANHASILKEAGYTTAYFGKWHCDAQPDRPGFDHVASYVGQGKFVDCPILLNGKQTPTSGWIDDVMTDMTIEFLKKQKGVAKPFNVVLGFKSPHGPRTPPARAKGRFAGETIRPVPNLDDGVPYRTKPEVPNRPRVRGGDGDGQLSYFRCVSAVDDCLGRVLDALDESGLAENTVVVYCSDNGYLLGEHGLGDKRAAYEESIRIPLLVRFPKRIKPGTTIDAMVLSIDYAPTLLELAGVPVPESMQGRSWTPLFDGKNDGWRAGFFYEYFFERRFKTPTTTAFQTPTSKLIVYPGHADWTELYDLLADPYELKNLVDDPAQAALARSMREQYDAELHRVGFNIPAHADEAPPTFD